MSIKAYKYRTLKPLSVEDLVHGNPTEFTEMFIPDYNIIFNAVRELVAYQASEPENFVLEGNMFENPKKVITPMEEIRLEHEDVEELRKIVETNKIKEKLFKKFSKSLE